MSDFTASVQFGDLKGTVSIDGHEVSGPLHDLAQHSCIKPGYIPIGFGMHQLHPLKNGKLPFTVYGVDASKTGSDYPSIQAYIAEHGTLSVVGFHGELEPHMFQACFKLFSLRAHSRGLEINPEQITIEGYDSGEEDGNA